MEWLFAKWRKGNPILHTLKKTVKSKLIETENEVMQICYYLSNFPFLILILLILISQNFKWELRSRDGW